MSICFSNNVSTEFNYTTSCVLETKFTVFLFECWFEKIVNIVKLTFYIAKNETKYQS